MSEELLNITEAARKLRVCKKTLRDWTNDGRLPCIRTLGNHRRFRLSDLEKILEVKPDGETME